MDFYALTLVLLTGHDNYEIREEASKAIVNYHQQFDMTSYLASMKIHADAEIRGRCRMLTTKCPPRLNRLLLTSHRWLVVENNATPEDVWLFCDDGSFSPTWRVTGRWELSRDKLTVRRFDLTLGWQERSFEKLRVVYCHTWHKWMIVDNKNNRLYANP